MSMQQGTRPEEAEAIKTKKDPLDPNVCNRNYDGKYTSRIIVREHVKFREAAMRRDFTEITDVLAAALKGMDEKFEQYTEELGEALEQQQEHHRQLIRTFNTAHTFTRRRLARLEVRWWERLARDIDVDVQNIKKRWNKLMGRKPSQQLGEQLDAFSSEEQPRG